MIAPLIFQPLAAPLVAGVLGAIFGSFIGALVARWPQNQSVMTGRSRCDDCGATVKPHHLVPVISYLVLRGRCTTCGSAISRDSLWIELIAAAIGALALAVKPGWTGVGIAAFGWLLLPLAWLDLRHFWLPHRLTAMLAAGAIAAGMAGLPPAMDQRIIGAVAGFGALWLVATGYKKLRGHDGMGGGDPWLLGAIGLWLGWQALPLVLLGASGIGLLVALAQQRAGDAISSATRFPLGSLLAIAAWPVALLYPIS